jgi:hypothetical protein
MTRNIAILTHKADAFFESTNYLVHPLAKKWEAMGLHVSVLRGTRSVAPADVLLPHIDLTIVPTNYHALMRRYPRVINQRILDISKSTISGNMVGPGNPYDGPVIVKTDRNYGGLPEQRLTHRGWRSLLRTAWGRAAPRRRSSGSAAWGIVEWLDSGSYPVFPSLRDVPRQVFENSHLVVERFLPEMDGDKYCVRYCYAFGSREFTLLLKSRSPVIKGSNVEAWEEVEGPVAVRHLRSQLGLDYAKIDYVLRESSVVLLDVNRTPGCSTLDRLRLTEEVAHRLAGGILELIHQDRPSPVRDANRT